MVLQVGAGWEGGRRSLCHQDCAHCHYLLHTSDPAGSRLILEKDAIPRSLVIELLLMAGQKRMRADPSSLRSLVKSRTFLRTVGNLTMLNKVRGANFWTSVLPC